MGEFELIVRGRSAHAGNDPRLGVSAITELAHQILAVNSMIDYERGTTLNVGVVKGGVLSNVVAAEARASIDMRFQTVEEGERITGLMRSLRPALDGHELATRDVLHGAVYTWRDRPGPQRPEDGVYALYARTARWKFVLYLRRVDPDNYHLYHEFAPFPARERGERDLFDLEQDPYERHDLASDPAHAELLDELQEGCLAWWRESGGEELELSGPPGENAGKKKGKRKKE